jgi:hypothetical protein
MTEKQFYDWQTVGGTDDVMPLVEWPGDTVVWSIARDGEAILLRATSMENALQEKLRAYSDPTRRQSKRLKDLADIARLVESHSELWEALPQELKSAIDCPTGEKLL